MTRKWLALVVTLNAATISAQTPNDTAHVKAQAPRMDSTKTAMDSLARWCRATSNTSPKYLRKVCPIVGARPDLRLRPAEDSLLVLPPVIVTPPPQPTGPKAAFTVSWPGTTATLDGRSSTGRIVSYTWRAPGTDRPEKTGAVITRGWGASDLAYTEWLIVRDSAGLVDSTSRQILGPPTSLPPVDTTTPPPPPSSGTIAAPFLPRTAPSGADPYPGRACTTEVPGGGSITAFLQSARGGSVVCTSAGIQYPTFQYPARVLGDTGFIVLRTNTALPPEGTRMRPSTSANLSKIVVTLNGAAAVTTTPGTWGYYTRGLEITTGAGVNLTYALVQLGDVGPNQDTMAEVPQSLTFAQVYIHGSATGEMQRCVALQSGATAIVDSWISDCHGKGYDSQAIGGWNGPGPHRIRNSYLEGAGENVMWGGATPSIPGMVASDITFTRNHVRTPASWKGVWTRKNLLETKNAVRVLIDSSVFEGSWTDAQTGEALLFKSINDQGDCRWCRTTDVTVRNSLVKNAGRALTFSGREDYNVGGLDSVAKRFLIRDVVFDSLNVAPYVGAGRAVQIGSGASDITIERTVIAGSIDQVMTLDPSTPSARTAFLSSVWKQSGMYFATPVPALTSMATALPNYLWQSMTVARSGPTDALPAGTTVVTSESQSALAAQIRATVQQATAGVVIPPN